MAVPCADVRVLIRKAIIARFLSNTDHDFYTEIGGRLAYAEAPEDWALPYAVFFFVDVQPDDTFGGRNDKACIQLSVWAETASSAEDISALAYGMFESVSLATNGIVPFKMKRDTPVPTMNESDGIVSMWQSGLTLSGLVQTV